ncbi:MAG: hypothetical protein ACREX3_14655 [Gammaproteobacteria bacterium]
MTRTVWLTRALVVLVLIQALIYWKALKLIPAGPFTVGGIVALVYLLLTITSFVGLLLIRSWGFYALYALIVFGTVMLSIKFLPVPLTFLPIADRWIGLAMVNLVVFVLTAVAHYWSRRAPAQVAGGAA